MQEASTSSSLPPRKKPRIALLFANFLKHIVELDPMTDERGETYLDLNGAGFITDQNGLQRIRSRETLWKEYPKLEGRLVILPFHDDLLKLTKQALEDQGIVIITGTPGVGKSTLRTAHVHSFLRHARRAKKPCRIILGKGGKEDCIILTLSSDGTTTVDMGDAATVLAEQIRVSDPEVGEVETQGDAFVLGKNCFVLVDVSKGYLGKFEEATAGLVVYSSPSSDLVNNQIFKAGTTKLAYPLVEKEVLLRYKNDKTEELFDKFGGLPRVVWGNERDEESHVTRLQDSL